MIPSPSPECASGVLNLSANHVLDTEIRSKAMTATATRTRRSKLNCTLMKSPFRQ